jgi:hypothetical protein
VSGTKVSSTLYISESATLLLTIVEIEKYDAGVASTIHKNLFKGSKQEHTQNVCCLRNDSRKNTFFHGKYTE